MAKQEKKEFDFINEQIKTRPFYKKKWFARMMTGIGCAVVFGGVAGVTFAIVKPWAEKQFGNPEPQTQIVILPEESESETESAPETESALKTESMPETENMSETESAPVKEGVPETESAPASETGTARPPEDVSETTVPGTEHSAEPTTKQAESESPAGNDDTEPSANKEETEQTSKETKTEPPAKETEPESKAPAETSGAAGTHGQTENTESGGEQEEPEKKGMGIEDYKMLYGKLAEVAGEASKSVVTVTGLQENANLFDDVYGSDIQSSGLIVATTGLNIYILTEWRTLDGSSKTLVTFPDGCTAEAVLQKRDPETGLAIVRVAFSALPADMKSEIKIAELGSSQNISKGDPVIAVGSPLGYSNSIAFGMVTSMTETPAVDCCYNVITTDMIGSPNGSGIILDLDGKIIGIISQDFYKENEQITVSGICISELRWLIETLSNDSEIQYLGIVGKEVTDSVAKELDMPKGLYVKSVEVDSPAMYCGIRTADVITAIQGTDIENMDDYVEVLRRHKSEDVLKITLMRQGPDGYVEMTKDITVGAR